MYVDDVRHEHRTYEIQRINLRNWKHSIPEPYKYVGNFFLKKGQFTSASGTYSAERSFSLCIKLLNAF